MADNSLISTIDKWSDPIPLPYPGIDPSLFLEHGRTYLQGCFSLGRVDSASQPSFTINQFGINVETGAKRTEPREIWAGHSCADTEGPHICKVGYWYYLVVAEGGTFEHHMLSIARTRDMANSSKTEQANGGRLCLPFGTRRLASRLGERPFWRVSTGPVMHGWPEIEHPQSRFTPCLQVVNSGHGRERDFQERIRSLDPRLEGVYIRDPEVSCYSLPEPSGHGPFALFPSRRSLSLPVGICTFIGRRQRSPTAVAEAEIDLRAIDVRAGLAVYKDHLRHLTLDFDSMTRMVTFRAVHNTTALDEPTATTFLVEPTAEQLLLKIVASADEYHSFATTTHDDERHDWVDLGSWETKRFAAREMTGPILGLYAHAVHGKGQQTAVVFPRFVVHT